MILLDLMLVFWQTELHIQDGLSVVWWTKPLTHTTHNTCELRVAYSVR